MSLFTFLVAATFSIVAHGQVVPTTPGADVYTAGQTCHIAWNGDKNSTTNWKNMAIELMCGSNLEMVHLTTVATGLDGTVDGTFDHPCPDVTLNAPIFFYQFTAPDAGQANTQWTTRFTIKGADGHLDPAPNAKQPPPGNEPIPWGVAALQNPSTASAAPTFAPPDQAGSGAGASATGSGSASSVAGATTATTAPGQAGTSATSTSTKLATTTSSSSTSTPATQNSTSTNNTKDSAAVAVQLDLRLLQAVTVLAASAMGFATFL